MDSVPDVKTAIELYNQLSELWGSAGMYPRKWLSNEPEVLQSIPSSDCATEVDLNRGELPQVKTLGVLWCPAEDVFKFQVNWPAEKLDQTKQNFLKGISTLFDPLGLLTHTLSVLRSCFKKCGQAVWTGMSQWEKTCQRRLHNGSMNCQQWPALRFHDASEIPLLSRR